MSRFVFSLQGSSPEVKGRPEVDEDGDLVVCRKDKVVIFIGTVGGIVLALSIRLMAFVSIAEWHQLHVLASYMSKPRPVSKCIHVRTCYY